MSYLSVSIIIENASSSSSKIFRGFNANNEHTLWIVYIYSQKRGVYGLIEEMYGLIEEMYGMITRKISE